MSAFEPRISLDLTTLPVVRGLHLLDVCAATYGYNAAITPSHVGNAVGRMTSRKFVGRERISLREPSE